MSVHPGASQAKTCKMESVSNKDSGGLIFRWEGISLI
jgi:hypothetical protein